VHQLTGLQKGSAGGALLATAGVGLAAAVTAGGMHYALDWDWGSATVFGMLIAATNPVSVIATLKEEAGVTGSLRLLIESESLLNDGTAAVGFVAVLSMLAGENHDVTSIAGALLMTIAEAALIGALVGFGFMLLAGRTDDYLIEITLRTLAAYGSFFVAEHYQCSGVLAALTVMSSYRQREIYDRGLRKKRSDGFFRAPDTTFIMWIASPA
jgi:CPA1 family monovalent cation:H+ antiporter